MCSFSVPWMAFPSPSQYNTMSFTVKPSGRGREIASVLEHRHRQTSQSRIQTMVGTCTFGGFLGVLLSLSMAEGCTGREYFHFRIPQPGRKAQQRDAFLPMSCVQFPNSKVQFPHGTIYNLTTILSQMPCIYLCLSVY